MVVIAETAQTEVLAVGELDVYIVRGEVQYESELVCL